MFLQRVSRSRISHACRRRRLQCEPLEDRRLLAVITVDTDLDVVDAGDGLTSLREAISDANTMPDADDIVFDFGHDGPTTILLEQGELEISEALTITGDGPDLLTIDGQEQSRIFNITAETGDFTIAGMTLTGGRIVGDNDTFPPQTDTFGGAIRSLTDGILVIENCEVSGNSTTGRNTVGGGVFAYGDVTVTGSTISGNSAAAELSRGGAIGSFSGTVSIADSLISGNSAGFQGGGIAAYDVDVVNSTISANSALSGEGGGISAGNDVTVTDSHVSDNLSTLGGGISATYAVTISSSNISENSAGDGGGGGIYSNQGPVAVTRSTVRGNSAGSGGGIAGNDITLISSTVSGNSASGTGGIAATSDLMITNSTISGNFADSAGAIRASSESQHVTIIQSSTIVGNSASGSVGGIVTRDGALTIRNSILAGNTDDGTSPDLLPGVFGLGSLTVEYSLIGDNTGTDLAEAPVGSPDTDGNLIGGPMNGVIDPMIGALAGNGGPTETHALVLGSPTIDAGNPTAMAGVGGVPEFDQRGASYGRVVGDRIDMGAHERQNLTVEILDVASPTETPVEEVTIQFSSTVTGFDVGDMVLSLNGGTNLLTGAETLHTSDNQAFVLGGLAAVTSGSGYYTLTLVPAEAEIVDADGGPLDAAGSISWAMGRSVLGLTVDTLVDEFDGSIDDGDISLRDAIAAAAPGETIDFDASLDDGTILLTLGAVSLARPLTIDATSLATGLIISAEGNDPTPDVNDGSGSRVFSIDDGNNLADSPVTIRGLTLIGGDVEKHGSAIHAVEPLTVASAVISGNSAGGSGGGIAGSSVTVTDSTISGNSAVGIQSNGGGISVGTVTVEGSTISDNTATDEGGGIYASGETTIISSSISGNSVGRSGGGVQSSGDLTVTSSTIAANSSDRFGGGISAFGDTTIVNTSTISGNSSSRDGGGLSTGNVIISNSTISDNSADRRGGGIESEDVTVTSSTISGNSATNGGGVFAFGAVSVVNSTVARNSAAEDGGGIRNRDESVTINHSIVADNTDDGSGPDLLSDSDTVSVEHSLIGDNTGTGLTEAPVGSPDANGNLVGGAVNGLIDPMLGPLTDNGGPTQTHEILSGSPAIDAGDPAAVGGVGDVPEFDQRGAPYSRIVDGDDDGTARMDMGAFEVATIVEPVIVGDMDGDSLVNFADLTPFALGLTDIPAFEAAYPDLASTRVERGDIDEDGFFNFGDLTPFVTLLTSDQAAASNSLNDGGIGQVAPLPGDADWISQPRRSQLGTRLESPAIVNTASVRDRALIAWLASLPGDDADDDTASVPVVSEAQYDADLATAVAESLFQGVDD